MILPTTDFMERSGESLNDIINIIEKKPICRLSDSSVSDGSGSVSGKIVGTERPQRLLSLVLSKNQKSNGPERNTANTGS